jgi:glycosyltransferase involved in cell wall biosynthesis
MKVFLYGNILNNSYNLTIFLRAKGIDAEMFLDDSSALQQDYPWWEDTQLGPDNLPPWIHYYRVNPNFLLPQPELKRMIADFSKCDVALVCGWGPIVAHRAGVPFMFHSYGSDLNITDVGVEIWLALRRVVRLEKPRGIRSLLLYGGFQKAAIKRANLIGIYMGYQIETHVRRLGLHNRMRLLRLAWDIDRYRTPENKELAKKYSSFEIVYFMVARQTWKSIWADLKGNDTFIRAFARFIKEKNPNVRLVMVEKGDDLAGSKQLIADLGIEHMVEWVKEMNKDGIRAFNSLKNVVAVDQFWHQRWYKRYPGDVPLPKMGFGSASIEAMSAERPLITAFFDEPFYEGNHPPILSAFTEDEVYQRLVESIEMGKGGREELGRRGYEFVKRYHGWEHVVELHIAALREIMSQRSRNSN